MAFIPTLNAIKLVIIGSIAGQQVVIDITVGTQSAPGITDLEDAADAIEDWMVADLLTDLVSAYTVSEIKAYDMSSATAPVVSKTVAMAGAVAQPPVPTNVALVASFRTENRGRSGRGRNYLPGLQNNVGSAVQTTLTLAGNIAASYANLNSFLTPLDMRHVVVSQFSNGAPRAFGLVQDVTDYIVNVFYDSQRKRLAGRGA